MSNQDGLTRQQLRILRVLVAEPGPVSVAQLLSASGLQARQGIRNSLNGLLDGGWVVGQGATRNRTYALVEDRRPLVQELLGRAGPDGDDLPIEEQATYNLRNDRFPPFLAGMVVTPTGRILQITKAMRRLLQSIVGPHDLLLSLQDLERLAQARTEKGELSVARINPASGQPIHTDGISWIAEALSGDDPDPIHVYVEAVHKSELLVGFFRVAVGGERDTNLILVSIENQTEAHSIVRDEKINRVVDSSIRSFLVDQIREKAPVGAADEALDQLAALDVDDGLIEKLSILETIDRIDQVLRAKVLDLSKLPQDWERYKAKVAVPVKQVADALVWLISANFIKSEITASIWQANVRLAFEMGSLKEVEAALDTQENTLATDNPIEALDALWPSLSALQCAFLFPARCGGSLSVDRADDRKTKSIILSFPCRRVRPVWPRKSDNSDSAENE